MDATWHSYKLGKTNSLKGYFHNNFAYNWDVSAAWRLVPNQYSYFSENFQKSARITISSVSNIVHTVRSYNIQKGDVMYFVHKNGGAIYHASIIVKVTDRVIYFAAHSNSQKEKDLSSVMSKNDKMYILRIKSSISKPKPIRR